MELMKIAEQSLAADKKQMPAFKAGDTVSVTYRIKEESKDRFQTFRGVVIQRRGKGITQTFTVRKISNGIGVERIIPLYSPFITDFQVLKIGQVRRARIFYLRKLTGKKARIKDKKVGGRVLLDEEQGKE
ncbi:MAG: 50S ribosomal protein L19 [Bacteroidales bacterium]|jgi:large subunit ribosomal protein L19|nr:50S ribosomal protein L19 [Bacteroidales bacterium]